MKRSEILFGILRVPVDALMAMTALLLAYEVRAAGSDLIPRFQLITAPAQLPDFPYYFVHFAIGAMAAYVLIAAALRLYALRTTIGIWREMARVIVAAALWLAAIIAWYFLVKKQLFFSRALLLNATLFLTMFTLIGRAGMSLIQRMFLRRGMGVRSVLSCGSRPLPESVETTLMQDVRFRYVGHVATGNDLMDRHHAAEIDLVLHTDPNPESGETAGLIDFCRSHHINYAFLPAVFVDVPHQLSIDSIGLVPVLRFEPTTLDGWGRVWKRAMDLVLGLMLFVIVSPFLLIIAGTILLTSGLPIFYVSRRAAQYGKGTVPVLKFRTMCRDADLKKADLAAMSHRSDGPLFKVHNDPRVTPVGRHLRRFSLDELPQLINVILGHLSLVGPRAHLPEEVAKYLEPQRRVLSIRPGVTGLAQISGRSNLKFDEEVKLDMRYIEEWSLALDFWILWRTVWVVLAGRGAE
ncbi:MAG: exopolysaccharide biosynthesis polyprenyl glycosylphosphotransferase [Candidatus Peribacteraceae bacterium]|nr:exopolysaccharide biosynthesis polyprenyl glycosylphosphotransferase [Candidatus Peribacteraceae bacterium]